MSDSRGQLSEFGRALIEACRVCKTTPTELARHAKLSSPTRVLYALHPRGSSPRGTPLPYELLVKIVNQLEKIPLAEREHLIVLGLLEHAPNELRAVFRALQAENLLLRKEKGLSSKSLRSCLPGLE